MIWKKTPLAIAITTVLSMSAYADLEITQSGTYTISNDIEHGVVIEDQTIQGLIDIDIKSSGKIADGLIIRNSNLSEVFIENNQGRIYAGSPDSSEGPESENDPFWNLGNAGLLIIDSTVNGAIEPGGNGERVLLLNTGEIEASDLGDNNYDAPGFAILRSAVNGTIINENAGSRGGLIEGYTGLGIYQSNFTGDIINRDNSSLNQATINALVAAEDWDALEELSVILGDDVAILVEDSTFTGNIINSGHIMSFGDAAIELNNSKFDGAINNTGTISGTNNGIIVKDNVTGSVVINQSAGSITAPLAIRLNKATTVNYTGGVIAGDVDNYGGTFYVEGKRVIAGDYRQNKDATLSLGLHKETSLTADSILLDAGSKLLVDVSKGTLYVANGESAALLIVKDGELVLNNVNPEVVGNQLVTIKGFDVVDGKLIATFERTSFEEVVKALQSSNQVNGQQITNFASVATALQSLGALASTNPAVASLLNNIDGSADSFNRLLPDNTGSSIGSARVASNMSNNQVSVRARGIASGDMVDTTGVWIQAMGANAKQKTRDGVEGYDADSWGLVLGSDVELNSGHVLGAAYSYINNDSDSRLSSSDTDYHMLTGYWGYAHGNLLMDAQVYYGQGNADASRQALNNTTASASYDSSLYGVRAAAGYQFDLGNETSFVPTLSLEHSRLSVDGYTETGSANNLIIGKQKSDRLELGLTGELSRTYQVNQNLVTPRVTLGAFHDFEADRQSINAAFAVAPSATFTSQGAKPNKTRYVAGVGVDLVNANDLTISAEYNYNWESSFKANAGAIKLRWEF